MKKILLILFLPFLSFSQNFDSWTDHLNGNEVTAVVEDGDLYYIGTKKGGLVTYNTLTNEKTFFTKSNSGLPSNKITSLAIDNSGNVWIGTNKGADLEETAGLAKYDGVNWTTYTYDNTGVGLSFINSMAVDSDNNLWIGTGWVTFGAGLIKFDGTNWTLYNDNNSILPNRQIHTVSIDENNVKWIGSHGHGLFKFDDTNWEVFDTTNSNIGDDTIYDIEFDSNGTMWLGTLAGLIKYDNTNWVSDLTEYNIYDITIDQNDDKWIAINSGAGGVGVYIYGHGVVKYTNSTTYTQYLTSNSGLPHDDVWDISFDSNGNKLIGTGHGLAIFDDTNWNVINTSKIPVFNDFTLPDFYESNRDGHGYNSIAYDSEGNVWCSAYNTGILKFDGTNWIAYTPNNSNIPTIKITSLVIDDNDKIWFGTIENGLGYFDGTNWVMFDSSNSNFPNDSDSVAGDITIDNNGVLWFHVTDNYNEEVRGLVKYDGTDFTQYNTTNSGLLSNNIESISIDANNNKWIGNEIGLLRYDDINWTMFNHTNSDLPDKPIYLVEVDNNDNKWISVGYSPFSSPELIKFDDTNWVSYNVPSSMTGGSIVSDNNNNIWLEDGVDYLYKFDGSYWLEINHYNSPLPNENIHSISVDSNDNIWVGTDHGISVFKEGLPPYTYVPDDNFEQALIDLGYDNVLDDYVFTNNINTITDLNVANKNISDLTGIEDFSELRYFYCEYNQLTSIDISQNTNLLRLFCGYNQITTINTGQNIALHWIIAMNNNLTSIDVSNNTLLTDLYVQYNQISSLDLTPNINLSRFYCKGNNLEFLDLRNGNNQNFDNPYVHLDENPNLTCIYVDNAQYSTNNWTNVDSTSTFVETEEQCESITDDDNDGVMNNMDDCPNTPSGETVDANGCSGSQLDDDNDGVTNNIDDCPDTPTGESVNTEGCSESQIDDDNDGIMNNIDECPNTPSGVTVNTVGCIVLPSNNFSVETISETCVNSNNGQIIITTVENHNYSTTINGDTYNFTNSLIVENLSPNQYGFCITVNGTDYEQCFNIEIEPGVSVSGRMSINSNKTSIEVTKGTAPYKVFVNGLEKLNTYDSSFEIDVNNNDLVEVKTSKDCEGVFSKTINTLEDILAYPNPNNGLFELYIPTLEDNVDLKIYTISGQLIIENKYPLKEGKVMLDINNQPSGIYFINAFLENSQNLYNIKIIKK